MSSRFQGPRDHVQGPAYLTRGSLAANLQISELTVDEMVRRGVLPKPVKLSPGCVRWRWATVDAALMSLAGMDDGHSNIDAGVQRAIQAAKERPSCGAS